VAEGVGGAGTFRTNDKSAMDVGHSLGGKSEEGITPAQAAARAAERYTGNRWLPIFFFFFTDIYGDGQRNVLHKSNMHFMNRKFLCMNR
jgi:hypothetical protein